MKTSKENTVHTVVKERRGKETEFTGTLAELISKFSYTLEKGKSWERERGNKKINMNPKTIDQLVTNLNYAEDNASANGSSEVYYFVKHS